MTRRARSFPLRGRALKVALNTWNTFHANAVGIEPQLVEVKPARKKCALTEPKVSERDIQKACLQLLRSHPDVACVWRQNSGTFTEQNSDGSTRYISAHTMPGLPDILGFLKGSARLIAFEVKRPGQHATPQQQAFIDRALMAGAIAAVITDPQQILELLK